MIQKKTIYSVRFTKILKRERSRYTRLKFFLHDPSINYKCLLSKYTRSMVQRVNLFNSCTMKVFDNTTTNLTLYKSGECFIILSKILYLNNNLTYTSKQTKKEKEKRKLNKFEYLKKYFSYV